MATRPQHNNIQEGSQNENNGDNIHVVTGIPCWWVITALRMQWRLDLGHPFDRVPIDDALLKDILSPAEVRNVQKPAVESEESPSYGKKNS
jgi:hypothetical protein